MSKSQSTSRSTAPIECNHPDCETHGKPWEFQAGYCSTRCKQRNAGREELADWKYSHTFCYTCLTRLKHVYRPDLDWSNETLGAAYVYDPLTESIEIEKYGQEESFDSFCGYQYLTPESDHGEKDTPSNVVSTGTICSCGNTNHTVHVSMLSDGRETVGRVVSLLLGQDTEDIPNFSIQQFHREYDSTGDLELALGRALE